MTSANHGASTPGGPGGNSAAGASPSGESPASSATVPELSDEFPHTPSGELDLHEAIHQVELEEAEVRPPTAGWVSNLLVAGVVVALGVAALIGSGALGIGSASKPDSGTWPMLISALLVALGLALALLCRRTADAEKFSRASWLVVIGLVTMIGFVALIATIGFEIPSLLLTFVWLRVLGQESWRSSVITSVGVVAAFYILFVAALQVPIPHLF
jgi:putative tricarboxylic transport membrane protein